ncbi:MAG: hypothetical protein ACK4N4_02000 [Burkholderiales bacterium]
MRFTATLRHLLAGAGLALGLALAPNAAADKLIPLTPPVPMPAFKLPGLNGTSGSDADLRNTVTIIRFWASW